MLPLSGVYAGYAELADKLLPAVISIGANPTFEQSHGKLGTSVEAHVLNFKHDVYGWNVRLHFHMFLRRTVRFENREQLTAQIKQDTERARQMLELASPSPAAYYLKDT